MANKRDDWAAFEYACEMMSDLRKRLRAGSEGSGVTLTPDECDLALANLKAISPPNSRPPRNWVEERQANEPIARHCRELEKTQSLKSAVSATATHFGCSVSKVYKILDGA